MALKGVVGGVVKTLVVVLIVIVAAVLTLPLWIGPVVTGAANSAVPKITKTGFHLGEFGLNPYKGTLHVADLQLQNPGRFFGEGEKSESGGGVLGAVTGALTKTVEAAGDLVSSSVTNAVSLGSLDVDLSVASLVTDTIRIREIALRDLAIYGDLTFSNIREIAANAAGEGGEEESKGSEAQGERTEGQDKGAETSGEGGKKVVIDRVLIEGTMFTWGHVKVPLPTIELKDIGKDEAVDEEGAFVKILEGLCAAADKAQAGLGSALKLAVEGGAAIGEGVKAVAGAVADGAGAVVDGAGTVVKGTADVATEAVKGVGDAAKGAADAVKGLFK